MKIKKAAAIPLILQDPFFSIWSDADHLYDKDPVHWCGERQRLQGYIKVDDAVYCFLGERGIHEAIPQQWVDVTATATEYMFENEKVKLSVRFTSPLLPDSIELLSRPCASGGKENGVQGGGLLYGILRSGIPQAGENGGRKLLPSREKGSPPIQIRGDGEGRTAASERQR